MIEDTSFIVYILRRYKKALQRLEEIEARLLSEKISAITILELHEGLYQVAGDQEERQQIAEVIHSKDIIPADSKIMSSAGELSGKLISTGQQIDREDCIIAATALREGEPVVTRNTSHFSRIDGLRVERY